jgi:hypothetical protein
VNNLLPIAACCLSLTCKQFFAIVPRNDIVYRRSLLFFSDDDWGAVNYPDQFHVLLNSWVAPRIYHFTVNRFGSKELVEERLLEYYENFGDDLPASDNILE